jgi:serine/threonine-protein kinase
MKDYQPTPAEKIGAAIGITLTLAMVVVAAIVARRNLRLGRGDRKGAFRLAAFVYAAGSLSWIFATHHVASLQEFGMFMESWVWGIGFCAFMWLVYIALEPHVRRRWPSTLVSWSRLLAGGFKDPMVGRDLLIGCLLGAFSIPLTRAAWFVPAWLGHPPSQ